MTKYVIIGGGIAGVSAAKTIREYDTDGEITIYTDEFHPLGLYARKDLARRLASELTMPDELLLDSQKALAASGIRFLYQPILRVIPKLRQVLRAHHIRRPYDRLLLALGATPMLADAPGLHYIGVHQLRNYEDALLVEAWMPALRERGAVIIGGGILALDAVYALKERGVSVTLVVREAQVGAPLLPEAAGRLLAKQLQRDGIDLIPGETLAAYVSDDERVLDGVRLASGRVIPARMALCAIGVRPRTELLEGTGIEVDEATGAIPVNKFMQTNLPGIFAAGSCALVGGEIARNWHASAEQGHAAGLNMVGQQTAYQPSPASDLETRIYNFPFAYFGKRLPSAHTTVWTWDDGERQFAQVLVESHRIVGATLLGEIASAAPRLAAAYRAGREVEIDDLKALAAEAVHSADF